MVGRRGWTVAVLAALAAFSPDLAFAGPQRDFVSGPWNGYAMFDEGEGRFRGCTSAVEGRKGPMLVWIRWADRKRVEVNVRNPPWTLRKGRVFRVTLSVDDAWRADAAARVLARSGGSKPAFFSLSGEHLTAVPRIAANGRRLTVEREGENPLVFSLAGAGPMLESLARCLRRGIALQRKADENDLKAKDFFVPQEDAEAFARWANKLSRTAYSATLIVGLGDPISRVVERFSVGPAEPAAIKFVFNLTLSPMRDEMALAMHEFTELGTFETATGDRDLGVVLRAITASLLREGQDTLRDTEGVMAAMLQGDDNERMRLYATIARRSYLSYAGDNIHLLVRNAARSARQLEYHLNQASRSINLMNVDLVNAILFHRIEPLTVELPELIGSSKEHVRNARRWIRSGRAILAERLSDPALKEDTQASRDKRALLDLYAMSLDEEEALADRFAAALTKVEAETGGGSPLDKTVLRPLVHGGHATAVALLDKRFTLRRKRWDAEESVRAR